MDSTSSALSVIRLLLITALCIYAGYLVVQFLNQPRYLTPDQLAAGTRALQEAIRTGDVEQQIEASRRRFAEIGGTVFVLGAIKP